MKQYQTTVLGEDVTYLCFEGESDVLLPIVIAHGWGGSSVSWIDAASLLQSEGYTVYVPDLPGFGSTSLTQVFTTTLYAQFLESFVNDLKLSTYHLVGHSNGGRMSMITSLGDGRIEKMILVNSAGISHPPGLKLRLSNFFAGVVKLFSWLPGYEFVRKCIYRLLGGHDYLNATNPLLRETFVNVVHDDIRDDMKNITTPTLIVWGSKDTYTPLADGKLIHSLIPHSQFVVCEGERHGIHLHNPALLVGHIMNFLGKKQ